MGIFSKIGNRISNVLGGDRIKFGEIGEATKEFANEHAGVLWNSAITGAQVAAHLTHNEHLYDPLESVKIPEPLEDDFSEAFHLGVSVSKEKIEQVMNHWKHSDEISNKDKSANDESVDSSAQDEHGDHKARDSLSGEEDAEVTNAENQGDIGQERDVEDESDERQAELKYTDQEEATNFDLSEVNESTNEIEDSNKMPVEDSVSTVSKIAESDDNSTDIKNAQKNDNGLSGDNEHQSAVDEEHNSTAKLEEQDELAPIEQEGVARGDLADIAEHTHGVDNANVASNKDENTEIYADADQNDVMTATESEAVVSEQQKNAESQTNVDTDVENEALSEGTTQTEKFHEGQFEDNASLEKNNAGNQEDESDDQHWEQLNESVDHQVETNQTEEFDSGIDKNSAQDERIEEVNAPQEEHSSSNLANQAEENSVESEEDEDDDYDTL